MASTDPMQDGKGLVAKLCEVTEAVGRIPKTGENSHFRYKFVEEHVVLELLRGELSSRGVMVFPDVVECVQLEDITKVTVAFTFVDAATGQERVIKSVGYGKDGQDKGPYKAITGATKYALMKTFLLPTGDDPEHDTWNKGGQGRPTFGKEGGPAAPSGPIGGPSEKQLAFIEDLKAGLSKATGQSVDPPAPKTAKAASEMIEHMKTELSRLGA